MPPNPATRRVVVTGLGTVNPLGNNVRSSWERLLTGESAVDWVLSSAPNDPDGISAGAAAFLKISGNAICGWLMAKCAIETQLLMEQGNTASEKLIGRMHSARHFAETVLPQTTAALSTLRSGQRAVAKMSETMFG